MIHRHIIFKLQKIKHKKQILKEARRGKRHSYSKAKIRTSQKPGQASREWSKIFNILREKYLTI